MFKFYVALKSISETRQDHRVHLVPRSHHNRKTRKFTKSKRRNNPEYNFKKEKGGSRNGPLFRQSFTLVGITQASSGVKISINTTVLSWNNLCFRFILKDKFSWSIVFFQFVTFRKIQKTPWFSLLSPPSKFYSDWVKILLEEFFCCNVWISVLSAASRSLGKQQSCSKTT